MNNRGLTLTELIVTVVIASVILLALTCQFVAELTFRTAINNQVAVTNEASVAMHHMVRVLRYAKPPVSINTASGYDASITATIDHAAAHPATGYDNLPEFTGDTSVTYGIRTADKAFVYDKGGTVSTISTLVTVLSATWSSPNLAIQLTAQKGNKSSLLNAKIRVLGG